MTGDSKPDGRDATCRDCIHFEDDPERIERELPRINILSSAFGSTRGDAGICRWSGRFHDPVAAAGCTGFEPRSSSDPRPS